MFLAILLASWRCYFIPLYLIIARNIWFIHTCSSTCNCIVKTLYCFGYGWLASLKNFKRILQIQRQKRFFWRLPFINNNIQARDRVGLKKAMWIKFYFHLPNLPQCFLPDITRHDLCRIDFTNIQYVPLVKINDYDKK